MELSMDIYSRNIGVWKKKKGGRPGDLWCGIWVIGTANIENSIRKYMSLRRRHIVLPMVVDLHL
jgi:hypothetical protein